MHNSKREMVKWQPFSAVVPGSVMINDVMSRKNKVSMPLLSDDQKNELQEQMMFFYNNQDSVNIKYYKAGKILEIKGVITNIDFCNHKLLVNKITTLFFSQIIEFFE